MIRIAAQLYLASAALMADQSTTGLEYHKGVSDLEEANAIELMRYVTPYSTPIDVLKDVSQYGPALMKDKLRFFSFVDTWVGPPGKSLWQDEAGTKCQSVQAIDESAENGFMTKAELLLWPEDKEALLEDGSTVPAGVVTQVIPTKIRPSPFGNALNMGQPSIVKMSKPAGEGGSLVELGGREGHVLTQDLSQGTEQMTLKEGEVAKVYACEEPKDVQRALREHGDEGLGLGDSFLQIAQEAHAKKGKHSWDIGPDHGVDRIGDRLVSVRLDANEMQGWHRGAQVYAKKMGPSDPEARPAEKGNRTYGSASWAMAAPKHHPIGFVKSLDMSDAHQPRALVEIVHGCPCEDENVEAYRVAVAARTHKPGPLQQLGVAAQRDGKLVMTSNEQHLTDSARELLSPAFVEVSAKSETTGTVKRTATAKKVTLADSKTRRGGLGSLLQQKAETTEPVCVMRMPTEEIGHDTVDFGEVKSNERIFAHITGSGHGWEHTKEKCGEFCDATYSLKVNGQDAGKELRFWRDDCHANPNSDQMGTWQFSRNGWCPGAVANGRYVEVTHLVKQGGKLPVALNLNKVQGVDGTYSNMQGFAFDDKAMFQTSLTFHRYQDAPEQEKKGSLVETAVVRETPEGDSLNGAEPPFLKSDGSTGRGDNGPWHQYDHSLLEQDPPLYRINAFSGQIHEIRSRLLTTGPLDGPIGIDKSVPWRIALRLRLEAPPRPFKGDEWDRVASIGILGEP